MHTGPAGNLDCFRFLQGYRKAWCNLRSCYQQSKISQCLRQERGGWMCEVRDLLSSSHLRVSFQTQDTYLRGDVTLEFRLYLDLEGPIRRDDSNQSRQINEGDIQKHNQLHSYILRGFFLLNRGLCRLIFFFFCPSSMQDLSSPTRDQTGRPLHWKCSLNHWTSREGYFLTASYIFKNNLFDNEYM